MTNHYSTIGTVQLTIELEGSQIKIRINPRHSHSTEIPNKGPAIIFFEREGKKPQVILPITKSFIVIHDSFLIKNLSEAAQQRICIEILVRDNENNQFEQLESQELIVEGLIIPASYKSNNDPDWLW